MIIKKAKLLLSCIFFQLSQFQFCQLFQLLQKSKKDKYILKYETNIYFNKNHKQSKHTLYCRMVKLQSTTSPALLARIAQKSSLVLMAALFSFSSVSIASSVALYLESSFVPLAAQKSSDF